MNRLPAVASEVSRGGISLSSLALVAQELVDRGLCPRALVDALDDDGAVEARPGGAVLHRLARQRAGYHHRIGRHLALHDLATVAIDDPGGSAEIDPHGENRALAHHDALGDLRASPDEAIVLDDHRAGLQRLEHAADAGAARDMAVAADLRTGADGRPGVHHGAGIH